MPPPQGQRSGTVTESAVVLDVLSNAGGDTLDQVASQLANVDEVGAAAHVDGHVAVALDTVADGFVRIREALQGGQDPTEFHDHVAVVRVAEEVIDVFDPCGLWTGFVGHVAVFTDDLQRLIDEGIVVLVRDPFVGDPLHEQVVGEGLDWLAVADGLLLDLNGVFEKVRVVVEEVAVAVDGEFKQLGIAEAIFDVSEVANDASEVG